MRHLQAALCAEAYGTAAQQAQAVVQAMLFAGGEEQLHAEADTKQRLAAVHRLPQRAIEAGGGKLLHRVAEGTDSRQQYAVRSQKYGCITAP